MRKQVTVEITHPTFGSQSVVLEEDGTVSLDIPDVDEAVEIRIMEIRTDR